MGLNQVDKIGPGTWNTKFNYPSPQQEDNINRRCQAIQKELSELAQCAEKNDVLVLSDEIYGLLDHSSEHQSFASFYPRKTITTTGLSKWCGAGGWRLGAAFLSDSLDLTTML